jgi:hypothetical protein
MPLREFTDSTGVAWRVWDTVPTPVSAYDERLKAGWLTFQDTAGSRKRLAPIPRGWEEMPVERLELMCRVAELVVLRTGTTRDPDLPDELPDSTGERPSKD